MFNLGTPSRPLRIAIIGAGPAGFYTAEHLLKAQPLATQVDLYDRLPTPYGLVRAGVAPDHQKIKAVTKLFDKVADNPAFRFFGNVELGKHLGVDDLRRFYHAIVYTTGAQTDKNLNIPGIDLQNSHAATEFVAWYNGHPDYQHCQFDLSQERVAVIGMGNVAIDVARILCRTADELAQTDIAEAALHALAQSRVKEVYIIGRRGLAQAAFTATEIKELGELANADITVPLAEVQLDPLSQAALAKADRATLRKVEIVQGYASRPLTGKPRRLTLRFLRSPTALIGDAHGRLAAMQLVRNELYATLDGNVRAKATSDLETLDMGLLFRSIGYEGVPLPGVPFDATRGTIPNQNGRVFELATGQLRLGEYTAGWIKRGPSGVIGTNKQDAAETVEALLADAAVGQLLCPDEPDATAVALFVRQRQPAVVDYADWLQLNQLEESRGQVIGRPRLKFTAVDEMLQALAK